jgi:catechol 2,3-dioxygenase-like lactoylglutathione lyase family enzyme
MAIAANSVTVLLQVFDMRKSVWFYCDTLGFELLQKHEPEGHLYWAMLKLGGATIMLNSMYEDEDRPPQPDPNRVTTHRDTTPYFSCPNVDEAYEHLRAKRIDVKPPKVAYYGMKQLSLADPDGYELCFQQPA